MQNVLLLAAVAAAVVFGWLLMVRLDSFLEENRHAQKLQLSSDENTLRLGFCNPTVVDSIADALEQFSQLYPNISVRIFCGAEGELLKALSDGRLDVIFLPQNAEIPPHMYYNSIRVYLNCTPVMTKCAVLPIEPITDGNTIQNVLWIGEEKSAFVNCFIKHKKDNSAAPIHKK